MKPRIFDRAVCPSQTFKCYSRSSNQIKQSRSCRRNSRTKIMMEYRPSGGAKMGLIVNVNCAIGKQGHYFIKRPVNKRYPLEIRNSDNSVVKNSSENYDIVDYGL